MVKVILDILDRLLFIDFTYGKSKLRKYHRFLKTCRITKKKLTQLAFINLVKLEFLTFLKTLNLLKNVCIKNILIILHLDIIKLLFFNFIILSEIKT